MERKSADQNHTAAPVPPKVYPKKGLPEPHHEASSERQARMASGNEDYDLAIGSEWTLTFTVLAPGTAQAIAVGGELVVGRRLCAIWMRSWILIGEGGKKRPR